MTSLIHVFCKLSSVWLPSGSLNVRTFKMKLRYTPYLCVGLQREAETVLSNDSDAVCSTAPFPRRKTGRTHNDLIDLRGASRVDHSCSCYQRKLNNNVLMQCFHHKQLLRKKCSRGTSVSHVTPSQTTSKVSNTNYVKSMKHKLRQKSQIQTTSKPSNTNYVKSQTQTTSTTSKVSNTNYVNSFKYKLHQNSQRQITSKASNTNYVKSLKPNYVKSLKHKRNISRCTQKQNS